MSYSAAAVMALYGFQTGLCCQCAGALFALKKRKMYEAEITKLQGAMMNLETQAMSLEASAGNMDVFSAMRVGAKAMGAVRHDM